MRSSTDLIIIIPWTKVANQKKNTAVHCSHMVSIRRIIVMYQFLSISV